MVDLEASACTANTEDEDARVVATFENVLAYQVPTTAKL